MRVAHILILHSAMIINLGSPGRYLSWSIFQISLANFCLILAMLAIFVLALILPFKKGSVVDDQVDAPLELPDPITLTGKLRNKLFGAISPVKLLPDTQPAYVNSFIYVFGVATLSALFLAIVSGFLIALGGPDWWHLNSVGRFFNSMHLWSVEMFMAFMVIHLWGKFWMSAWRGKRASTWITGVIAFLASIVECFTGYLSQQNFDSQWISSNGKDAFNAIGLGAFFNLMNFGQMLLFHVVLFPLVLLAVVVFHVVLVRKKGVVKPIVIDRKLSSREAKVEYSKVYTGKVIKYDLVKEGIAALLISAVLVLGLSFLLSSPDLPSVTIESWARIAPADFMGTVVSELDGTSETAQYGPPYNSGSNNVQKLGPAWQQMAGIREPIDPAKTFVLSPLQKFSVDDPVLAASLNTYLKAPSAERHDWLQAYSSALTNVKFVSSQPVVPRGNYGPVAVIVSKELNFARQGALDADLLSERQFYGTNFTKPILFLEDGQYFSQVAMQQHLQGTQWGVMNETGSYPGQPWLWLYALWYQMPGFKTSANVDLIAIYLTGTATAILFFLPYIPVLRKLPEKVPVYRIIWKNYYKNEASSNDAM